MNNVTKTCALLGTVFVLGCSLAVMDNGAPKHDDDALGMLIDEQMQDATTSARLSSSAGSYLAGRSASMHNDHQEAARYLSHALSGAPEQHAILPLSLKHALLSGDMKAAIDYAHKAETLKAPNRLSRLVLFIEALKSGDMQQAQTRSKTLESSGIHALIVPFIHSWMEYAAKSTTKRISIADGLRHGYYSSLQHYHQALQLAIQGNHTDAETAFDKATTSIHKSPDAAIFGTIRFFTAQGNQGKAEKLITAMQEAHPRDPLWRSLDATSFVTAFKEYHDSDIATINDGVAEVFSNMAELLYTEGALQEAHHFIAMARYLRPDDQFIQYVHAQIIEDSGRDKEALQHFQAITAPSFLLDLSKIHQARLHHTLEQPNKAKKLLKDASHTEHTAFNRALMLGDIARAEKAYADAADYYTQAINTLDSLNKHDWDLLYRRGIMYDQAKQWDKAETDFQQALDLSPKQPQVLNYLAYSWLIRGENFDKAESMLKQAISLRPNDAHIIDSYGWALYKLERYAEALPLLTRALDLLPSDPTINDHYGDVLWQLGRGIEATYHWERALLFEPPEPKDAEAIKRKLAGEAPQQSIIQQSNAH